MNKSEIIKELKLEYPTLSKGINDEVIELDAIEYEKVISEWADVKIAKATKQAEAEAKATQRAALLERLGITEAEAKLLLG
jgi:hypothetical protein